MVIAALVACSGCGGGCGRENGGTPASQRTSTTTTTSPPTTIVPVVHHGQTYRLYRLHRWSVGDVVTREATTVITGRVTEVAADGRQSRLPTSKQTVHAAWLEKAVDVDDDGHRTRYLIELRTWLRTQADARDESLQGTTLAVSGTGAKRTWSFVGHDAGPNTEAKSWLDAHFGSHGMSDEQWLRMVLPDDDVGVGESWKLDPVPLANEMEASGLTIDRSSLTATVKLEAIESGSARCSFGGQLGVLRIPNSDVPLSKGTMTFEGELTVPLEPEPLVLSTVRNRATLEGETSKEGEITRIEFASDERSTTTPGGELSEPEE